MDDAIDDLMVFIQMFQLTNQVPDTKKPLKTFETTFTSATPIDVDVILQTRSDDVKWIDRELSLLMNHRFIRSFYDRVFTPRKI